MYSAHDIFVLFAVPKIDLLIFFLFPVIKTEPVNVQIYQYIKPIDLHLKIPLLFLCGLKSRHNLKVHLQSETKSESCLDNCQMFLFSYLESEFYNRASDKARLMFV